MRITMILAIAAGLLFAEEPEQISQSKDMAAFNKLQAEHQAATKKFYADFQKARKEDPNLAYDFSKHPDNAYVAKYEELARELVGTDGAAHCLAQVARLGRGSPAATAAAETLCRDHIKSKAIQTLAWTLRFQNDTEKLGIIVEKSPHRDIRGFAMLCLAQVYKPKDEKKAIGLFEQVIKEYGDVNYFGRSTLGKKAEGEIFEVKHLVVGKAAPEIEGEDIDGNPMKLSDFKGKIVFLDFWGDW
ncbi:MAG: TlpA family protein disulfide reductase [Planctomycetota bacterium]|jgi:hypothetical protein